MCLLGHEETNSPQLAGVLRVLLSTGSIRERPRPSCVFERRSRSSGFQPEE